VFRGVLGFLSFQEFWSLCGSFLPLALPIFSGFKRFISHATGKRKRLIVGRQSKVKVPRPCREGRGVFLNNNLNCKAILGVLDLSEKVAQKEVEEVVAIVTIF